MLQLSEEDANEFREIFDLVDQDGSGKISPAELGELTKKLGLKYSESQLEMMVREIDIDRNGEIDFEEFITVMSRQVQPSYTPQQLKHAFSVFSTCDKEGHINVNDLEYALTMWTTDKLPREKAHRLIKQISPDSLSEIDYNEFINVMTFSSQEPPAS
ncbi:calmodulin-like protein [Planoprotostelium fungivorum]|uniref:Calmodulin-like protein n=1 Tax=Planoprotostelium fungivorum TaxID=1890364 RepID=A0A2P6NNK2_9EUKA|nr:calmodulin-like protein [Planoprotostelium fungivorum]